MRMKVILIEFQTSSFSRFSIARDAVVCVLLPAAINTVPAQKAIVTPFSLWKTVIV